MNRHSQGCTLYKLKLIKIVVKNEKQRSNPVYSLVPGLSLLEVDGMSFGKFQKFSDAAHPMLSSFGCGTTGLHMRVAVALIQ